MTTNTREIKFRAWDSRVEKWYASYNAPFEWLGENEKAPEAGVVTYTKQRFPDGIILMQYTGVKDKNGKEIYEGDVVRIQSESHKSGLVEVVKWIDPTNWVSDVCAVNGFVNHESIYKTKPEIIGNIYENPELLNHD